MSDHLVFKIIFFITLLLISPIGFVGAFWGQKNFTIASMAGTSYRIITDSLNSGGNDFSDSDNYILFDTIGEVATGPSESDEYKIFAGYRQMQQDSYIAISAEADLNLASIPGLSGGFSTGSITWKVTTDNYTGYSLSIKATSSPAMISNSGGYVFSDYSPIGSDYNALEFDGSNDYAIINNNFVSSPTELTIISRFRKISGGSTYETTIHKASTNTVDSSDYWTGVTDQDKLVATIGANQSGIGWQAGLTTITADYDTWYDVAAVWDGFVVKVYVDGVYQKQYDLTTYGNLNRPTRFGASSDGANYQFRGFIGENRIYTRALSDDEIALFSADVEISDDNLVGRWKFDDGLGNTITDYSGGGNDATTYNDPVWTSYQINPDFDFSILSIQSAFGFTPEGSDIIDRFRDNGSNCNVISGSNTADRCWAGLSTSDILISQSASSNQPSGTETTVKFRAESGSSNVQPAADYSATIIITAVTL